MVIYIISDQIQIKHPNNKYTSMENYKTLMYCVINFQKKQNGLMAGSYKVCADIFTIIVFMKVNSKTRFLKDFKYNMMR